MGNEENYLTFKDLNHQHFEPVGWYHDTFPSDFQMTPHLHQQFEIMYCEKGAFSLEYNQDTDTVLRVSVPEKCFILLNTGYYHKIVIDTPKARVFNIELFPKNGFAEGESPLLRKFSPSAREIFSISPQLADLQRKNERFYIFHDSHDVGTTVAKLVESLLESDHPSTDLSARLLITELFLDISCCSFTETSTPFAPTYVRKAILYIQQNFSSPIAVADVAAAVGIAPAYLQRLFKAELNESIHTAITRTRIKNAKMLLKNTSLSHTDIAELSGFGTREKMIYAFKAQEKCSPHEYRQSTLEKNMRAVPWPHDVELY